MRRGRPVGGATGASGPPRFVTHPLAPPAVDLDRSSVSQRLVRALFAIETQILADARAGLPREGVLGQIDVLVLEGAPQALREDVVHAPPAPIHTDGRARLLHPLDTLRARKVAALVAVEDRRDRPRERPID